MQLEKKFLKIQPNKEMKILLLKWEIRKLKNKLNNEKLKVDNGLDVSKLSDSQ